MGRAGTGKTYASHQITANLECVAKVAFTNKAALNIGGKTIHKFLKMGADGQISLRGVKASKTKAVVVDEISMIPMEVWRRLVEVKRATGMTFILVGGRRQCGPVESEEEGGCQEDYFDHPAVKYLAAYTFVNDLCMQRHKPAGALLLPADPKDEYTQDTWLYPGLPLIACRNVDTKEHPEFMVNNEYFTLSALQGDTAVCTSTRPGAEGGETIAEPFTIWDWDRMDKRLKYTAMSRAKLPSQINFASYRGAKGAGVGMPLPPTILPKKLASYCAADARKGLAFDLDKAYVQSLVERQGGRCYHCHGDLLLPGHRAGDERQYSMDRIDDTQGHLYYDPKVGLQGKARFKATVWQLHPDIPARAIDAFLGQQELLELRQVSAKAPFTGFFKIVAPPRHFQLDIFFLSAYKAANSDTSVFLILIDVLSCKMWVYPLKSRTQGSILQAIQRFVGDVKEIKGLAGDDEFSARKIADWCYSQGIELTTNVADTDHMSKGNKLGIVDVATKTIKHLIRSYIVTKQTTCFIDTLPDLVGNYNDTKHSTLGHTPDEAWADSAFQQQLYDSRRTTRRCRGAWE
ncbi:hypothetical protein GPECTOR_90g530 [Gonium pectorale]|uniref:Integrase catalytic domain-containing protein n=1 Tax=Gonium pectorale TaxID=33097 RepID=A0A150G0M7_GONPE|nr:hypothetical protein GPECTOR_90g530 [Gonium pectorale]|eukprot:KXZ43443.1 hypothetical protein GPECTOR_90g530 [Gonium pectorale]